MLYIEKKNAVFSCLFMRTIKQNKNEFLFGGNMKNSEKRKYVRALSFFTALSLILAVVSVVNGIKAHNYKIALSVSNERSLSELCENLDNISTVLEKGIHSSSSALGDMSEELSKSASCAKVSLGQLTDETMITDELYKFLSQVGAFTASLVKKTEEGGKLSEEEKKNVKKLYEYSLSLSKTMGDIRDGYYSGEIDFEKSLSNASTDEKAPELFSDSISEAGQSSPDYPTLIYDGPFSDTLLQRQPVMLNGKDEITAEEAKKLASDFLGAKENEIRTESDENSDIGLYCFSAGEKSVGITKRGGLLCYMTNPEAVYETTVSEDEGIKRASKYLSKSGYENMAETYYSTFDGVCTVNFAYEKDGITYYADLIKVSVSLKTGEVVAFDARGFITNHRERSIPEIRLGKETAAKRLSENLNVKNSKIALIPKDTGIEKLCYEFHCTNSDNKEYLVYINAETGNQEDILILLYEDGGTVVK